MPKELIRKDIRLTVDYPEDLILRRAVYQEFLKDNILSLSLNHIDIVKFLDKRKDLLKLIHPFARADIKVCICKFTL